MAWNALPREPLTSADNRSALDDVERQAVALVVDDESAIAGEPPEIVCRTSKPGVQSLSQSVHRQVGLLPLYDTNMLFFDEAAIGA